MQLTDYREADKVPFVVVLDNVRSLHNVGSVFRTSDASLQDINLSNFKTLKDYYKNK